MVAVFRDRLGTPTDRAVGGAVEEVRDFDKPVLLYVYEANEARILGELKEHISKLENRTWKTYSGLTSLETCVRTDIASWFNEAIKPVSMAPVVARPRLFIEEQFPVAEVGIESVRERAAASSLPPIYFLHVWWARRPLVASAAAVIGSLLPAWSARLAEAFPYSSELQTNDAYRQWFLRLCGIIGDPVAGRRAIDRAKITGERLKGNGYGYPQAFKNSRSQDLELLHQVLNWTWNRTPKVLDPTAGGGSIPFEAMRFRLPVVANDLNAVSAAILRAGLELPATHGTALTPQIKHQRVSDGRMKGWGVELIDRLERRLAPYFERDDPEERVMAYLWARTVTCPRTGKLVPLVSDWTLRRGQHPMAVRLVPRRGTKQLDLPEFEILEGEAILASSLPPVTWSNGRGISPWDDLPIDSAYIKSEAQRGRLGEVLYAIATRTAAGRSFRLPNETDHRSVADAEVELLRTLPQWVENDTLPKELVPLGNDLRPIEYGMPRWQDLFSSRQLLVHGGFVEEFIRMTDEVRSEGDRDHADAVLGLLGMMQGKALNYNGRLSSWHAGRQAIRPVFDSHNFAFKSTFAEFDGSYQLYRWCLDQLVDAYDGIAKLLEGSSGSQTFFPNNIPGTQATVMMSDAGNLQDLEDSSQALICIDPPYYDNVMYAELADYFYAWEKRTLGKIWPEFFAEELTDKRNEAVASKASFASEGREARAHADSFYKFKMQAIFQECHRVLANDGVLTVMFTHKRADAWDALGTALLNADFTLETSWPVRTESEQSLHQARSNSAASTIFLVCRKRLSHESRAANRTVYLDEIEGDIRRSARESYSRSFGQGLRGVDLLLSTYGPVLSVLSRYWPVYSEEADQAGQSRELRPEEALELARAEVTRLMKDRVVGRSSVDFDPMTDFWLLAWEVFKARQMPFDEARRLALAVGGLEMDDLVRDKMIVAKSGKVTLCEPRQRLRRDSDADLAGVNRSRRTFTIMIDAVHTALYIVSEDGVGVAKRWLDQRNLTNDQRFLDCLQALANAMPRSKNNKGEWNVTEAGLLERLVTGYFPSITVPPDPFEHQQQAMVVK